MWSLCSLCLSAGQLLRVGMSAHPQPGGATWVTETCHCPKGMFPRRGGRHRTWMEAYISTRKEQRCTKVDLSWLRSSLVCRTFLLTGFSCFRMSPWVKCSHSPGCVVKRAGFHLERGGKPTQWYLCNCECGLRQQLDSNQVPQFVSMASADLEP